MFSCCCQTNDCDWTLIVRDGIVGQEIYRCSEGIKHFLEMGKKQYTVICHNVETLDSKEYRYITKIWCKLCATVNYKNQIINCPIINGAAVNVVTAFADGTEVVTKFQVGLHFHVSLT